jgi:hypothetical protein
MDVRHHGSIDPTFTLADEALIFNFFRPLPVTPA